ncbi:peptidylprolyl isomerase [Thioclava sp. SK-1]|uniref:peptidylprolyl isomerase n=1 Tax=Thioclava sp. SK-1 TaxID=1889770 RepID=UPI000825B7AC|nr:peptidylprolyl isomerase [Thioclava sp. SK-1]OCX61700.1 peptidylprolyl isomerase [Thioclava sp. SK-1]
MAKLTKIMGLGAGLVLAGTVAFAQDAPTADTVVATVDGKDITIGQMIVVRDGLPQEYLQLDPQTLFNGILDQLIQQTALAKMGESRMTKRDRIALDVQRNAYLAGSMLEYTAQRATSDDAVQSEYKTRFETADPVTEYHAAHIIVATEEEAADLTKQIQDGADFTELAKEHSTDGAADNGGDLGWFGLDMMVQPFADAVAGMEPGDVVGPVQTEYGWHVVKLIETRVADAPAIEDVRAEIEADLQKTAVEDRIKSSVDDADVERMSDGIDPSVLTDQTLLAK